MLLSSAGCETIRGWQQIERYQSLNVTGLRVLGTLNEAQARVFVAQRALEEGCGGISRLSRLTGMSRPTIMKGVAELKGKAPIVDSEGARVRKPGGGRKRVEELDPRIERELKKILDERTAGDIRSGVLEQVPKGEWRGGISPPRSPRTVGELS